jgi:hypothetical protein
MREFCLSPTTDTVHFLYLNDLVCFKSLTSCPSAESMHIILHPSNCHICLFISTSHLRFSTCHFYHYDNNSNSHRATRWPSHHYLSTLSLSNFYPVLPRDMCSISTSLRSLWLSPCYFRQTRHWERSSASSIYHSRQEFPTTKLPLYGYPRILLQGNSS